MSSASLKVSLVLLGNFMPDEFMPKKLVEGGVISKKAGELASFITLMPSQAVEFSLPWGEVSVIHNKFQVTSIEAPHIRICDLVIKALMELSPKSKVNQFGINIDYEYDFKSFEERNKFGLRVAPPSAWGNWGDKVSSSINPLNAGTPSQGGLVTMQMRLPFELDGIYGWRDMVVAPSQTIKTGVLLRSNHHHQLDPLNNELSVPVLYSEDGKRSLLDSLSKKFDNSIDEAVSICEGIINHVN